MTQVKTLTKLEERYFLVDGIRAFNKFVSQETVMAEITDPYTGRKETKEVPKWEILIDPDHPKMKELAKIVIDLDHKEYSYEISFVDDGSSLIIRGDGKVWDKDKRKRIFLEEKSNVYIDIKDKLYSEKINELKKLNNLIPGEESKWRSFISTFRSKLGQLTNEDASKYQEGKKFIDELETELNKKTGKSNNDDSREREREQLRNYGNELRH
jgi:hypothetical protein